jgi:drug/metabolite transporter (DMT)-like permease
MKPSLLKAYLALMTTQIFWSSALVAIRYGVQSYQPGSMALLRLLTGSIAMSFVLLLKPKHPRLTWNEIGMIFWLGFLVNALYQTALSFGEVTVPAGIGGFIISTIPLYTTIGAVLFLKESLSPVGWFGISISLLGTALSAFGETDNFTFNVGVIYILISAISASTYILMAKPLVKKLGPVAATAYTLWAGTFFVLIFTPSLYHDLPQAPLSATFAVIYLGVCPTAIAYVIYNYALNKLPTTTAANWLYSIPLLTCLQAWLFLGEIPSLTATLGGSIALLGVVIVQRVARYQKPKPQLVASEV